MAAAGDGDRLMKTAAVLPTPPPGRLLRATVIGVFAFCAALFLFFPLAVGWARGHFEHAVWSYNGASIALSYFETGFARRELEATLIRPFTTDPMVGGAAFHALAYAALAALAMAATLRAPMADRQRLAVGAVFLAVLFRVGADVGRADPAVMVCGLVAAWAARAGRFGTAAAAIAVALALHEAGLIVLAPLVAGVAWENRAWRKAGRASRALGLAVAVLALAAYVLALLARPDVAAAARVVHAKFAEPDMADLSVYYTLSGSRGVASILCQQRLDGAYLGKVLKGAALIVLCTAGLRPRRWLTTLFAVLPPFLFLSAIAVDVARWTVFAAFAIAAMTTMEPAADAKSRPPAPLNSALAFLAAILMVAGVSFVDPLDPAPAVPNLMFGGRAMTLDALDRASYCDPGWRRFLGLA